MVCDMYLYHSSHFWVSSRSSTFHWPPFSPGSLGPLAMPKRRAAKAVSDAEEPRWERRLRRCASSFSRCCSCALVPQADATQLVVTQTFTQSF